MIDWKRKEKGAMWSGWTRKEKRAMWFGWPVKEAVQAAAWDMGYRDAQFKFDVRIQRLESALKVAVETLTQYALIPEIVDGPAREALEKIEELTKGD